MSEYEAMSRVTEAPTRDWWLAVEIWLCRDCGALVLSRETHDAYHAEPIPETRIRKTRLA